MAYYPSQGMTYGAPQRWGSDFRPPPQRPGNYPTVAPSPQGGPWAQPGLNPQGPDYNAAPYQPPQAPPPATFPPPPANVSQNVTYTNRDNFQSQMNASRTSSTGPTTGLVALGELEFRRQALSRIRWESQEEELRARVTMLENIIRRTNDLKPSDVTGHARVKSLQDSEQATRDEDERDFQHTESFAAKHQGPFLMRGQVPCEGYYVDPNKQQSYLAQEDAERAKLLQWRREHGMVMFLSGEHELLTRQFQGVEMNLEGKLHHVFDVGRELKNGTNKLIRDQ